MFSLEQRTVCDSRQHLLLVGLEMLVACSEELPAVVQRPHYLAFEYRGELYTRVPRLVRLELHFEPEA